ncbi:hypothetical protein FWD07_01445 [Candidatus Saccharibacteria bacterium]|nr:hypothetical protein [Candidatus Saccharibacteria bacterium]
MSKVVERRRSGKFVLKFLLVVMVLVVGMLVLTNTQKISDELAARRFEPSLEMSELIERLELTDRGRRVMLASRPQLGEGEWFNHRCTRMEREVNVLGCFRAGGIYVFNVQNEDLVGMNEVTLAHELLHAVWSRMRGADRERLERYLREVWYGGADDILESRMAYYDRMGADFYNELHSIIGTEFRDLPVVLEEHYARYFRNRERIVMKYESYIGRFHELIARSEELIKGIEALVGEINEVTLVYNYDVREWNRQVGEFNRRAETGDFADEAEFLVERRILELDQQRLQEVSVIISEKMRKYEELREGLSEVAGLIAALNRSIDSTVIEVEMIPESVW